MASSDIFIIQDIVPFAYHDFTNRNRIKTRQGACWLTVPVKKGRRGYPICDMEVDNVGNARWARRHWHKLTDAYQEAPYWHKYSDLLQDTYRRSWTKLIDLNLHLIEAIRSIFAIKTQIVLSSSLGLNWGPGQKSEFLIAECEAVGADSYLSGRGGREYLDTKLFSKAGLPVVFQDFNHPVYPQLHGEFIPNLSVLDYLLCTGARRS